MAVMWCLLERLNDTQVASVDVGIGKARTAAIFRRPSKIFEDQIRDGRVAALALPRRDAPSGRHTTRVNGRVDRRDRRQRQYAAGGRGHRQGRRCGAVGSGRRH